MVDDMWGPGPEQWEVFTSKMNRVFPGQGIDDVRDGDPERMTALAYRYGINYLVYAMTH